MEHLGASVLIMPPSLLQTTAQRAPDLARLDQLREDRVEANREGQDTPGEARASAQVGRAGCAWFGEGEVVCGALSRHTRTGWVAAQRPPNIVLAYHNPGLGKAFLSQASERLLLPMIELKSDG